ncbi:PREDICTED: uncharacterized protein LOC105458641 isoform X2 [Wasmannia auropunctata]|nr:PREDICTED: uncharacterized protein LOC105458641 isoform X2 [Wasmannia auropunctata]XP_011702584.1 PREDICTED: uncharacterized protein LOC105458641 isoform X2 [Wasmannia auropunctata]XP_011702658.1 PREDICTED: uncharacterized protein LOC105458641 isoform X2 [Wasmannia auropunctata]
MLRILMILSFICSLDLLSARPAEEPTKFTLGNTQTNAENVVPSKFEETKELLERVGDAIRIGGGRFLNLIILARNIIVVRAEQISNEFRNNLDPLIIKSDKPQSRRSISPVQSTTPIILFSTTSRKYRLENETAQAILERRKPDNILRLFLMPKPLVDRIKNEEKYGNTGDKFSGIGRAFINGYENFSNFLNAVVDAPASIVKQTTLGVTKTLNDLGARLIGLE